MTDGTVRAKQMDLLAVAIVEQAVKDWRALIRAGKRSATMTGRKVSFQEIRNFFHSDYCHLMLSSDPMVILKKLEMELSESRKSGALT